MLKSAKKLGSLEFQSDDNTNMLRFRRALLRRWLLWCDYGLLFESVGLSAQCCPVRLIKKTDTGEHYKRRAWRSRRNL